MYQNTLTNTGDTLAAMSPENQRQLWKQVADMFEIQNDPWAAMEGGSTSIIETITDTSKGSGHTITFPILSRFHGEGKQGENRFTSATDYEKIIIDSNSLTVDFIRNASNESIRTEEHMGMRGEILSRVPELLGDWLGRKKSEMIQMTILHRTNSENHIIAGGNTSVHNMTSADTLGWAEIVAMGALLEPMGGLPAIVGQDPNGNAIFANCVVATVPAMQSLDVDPTYLENQQQAGERGKNNKLFVGGVDLVKGHMIKKFNPIDHADAGAIGSPLAPKAKLGVAIASGSGALTIKGGGNATDAALTQILYYKWFPKYAFPFMVSDVLATSADFWELVGGNFFVTIVNPRSAATDPGKWGFYEISANNGNALTVATRLAAAIAGIANTTVGGVTWDATVNTDVHPEGSLVYLSTSKGLPLMATPMLGQRAIRRGYGMFRNERMRDEDEGGFGKYTYICSVFGQSVRSDRSGRVPGIVILKHTGPIEGWNIPVVA